MNLVRGEGQKNGQILCKIAQVIARLDVTFFLPFKSNLVKMLGQKI